MLLNVALIITFRWFHGNQLWISEYVEKIVQKVLKNFEFYKDNCRKFKLNIYYLN